MELAIDDKNGTIEQYKDFMSFVLLSYEILYVCQFHLLTSFHLVDTRGNAPPPPPLRSLTLQKPRWSSEGYCKLLC